MRFKRKQESEQVQIQEIDERHNLSQQVFFRREQHGWSQEELAERCGTTQAQIANIEAGNVNPTLLTLVKLAASFGCLAHDLLRPFNSEEDLDSPHTRDWARWSESQSATEQRPSHAETVVFVTGTEIHGYATFGNRHNDALALQS